MKIPALFKEYIWLVNTIRRAKRISLAEINEKWIDTDMSGGVPFARTTFNRHKDAIEDIFGIYIDCDRRDGYKYFIGNEYVLREDSVQNWMLSTLSVNNMISESLSLQNRILLENIPSDGDYLRTVIDAMKQNRLLTISYRRYRSATAKSYTISPYCIKLFHRRWYLLARYADGDFAMLSFDRICNIEVLKDKFEVEDDFDASEFFDECFGVVIGDGSKPVRIVVRAFGMERFYMRDLPIHPSQQEIAENEDTADFEFLIRPTDDFKAHILSRGQWLKVLEPQWLADEICCWLKASLEKYQKS
ncbi:MAG: WYL domain-containing protein [Muribaculaceae bacterium]|nr:WYL domain-containing protein [Muribaculaceae bacterium]